MGLTANRKDMVMLFSLRYLTRKYKAALPVVALATTMALMPQGPIQAASRVGTLECNVSGGVGFVITSSKALNCIFTGTNGRRERYIGTIRKFGLDVGITGEARLVWAVLAASEPGRGTLAGDYAGASASASAGLGAGANLLIGGARRSINLQPLSIQGQTGVNLTAGVSAVRLEYLPG